MTTYEATVTMTVRVEIHDPDVIARCVEDHDGWRTRMFYDLRTPEAVVQHLAYNCARNNVEDVSRLDGWADLPSSAVTMRVVDTEADDAWVVA